MVVQAIPSHSLVRYGVIPEVARCQSESTVPRGTAVVVETHRGLQIGTVLGPAKSQPADGDGGSAFRVLRVASADDLARSAASRDAIDAEFDAWQARIVDWNVDVQLIDLEWTLDRAKVVLYVLNDRGPECTKLAIQAAAAGLGIVDVQPVSREGLVAMPDSGGGCGSGGCGCHN
ncbi:MAG: hypothetical protein R3B90_15400 [Planctomycetaceae bacterium]